MLIFKELDWTKGTTSHIHSDDYLHVNKLRFGNKSKIINLILQSDWSRAF